MMNENDYRESDQKLAGERFELVARATHDVIWDWDLIKNTVWWNSGMQLIFGHQKEDLDPGSDSWHAHIHPDDQENVLTKIYTVIDQGGANWSDYYRFRRADGTYAHVHDRGYTIHQDGKPVRMVGSMQDITDHVLLLESQKESQQRLAFALKSAQLGAWDFDPAENKVNWDERSHELYGFSEKEIVTYQDIFKYIFVEDRKKVNLSLKHALDPAGDGYYEVEFRTLSNRDNKLRWLHCTGQAYFTNDGEVYRFSGIVQDITDKIADREKAYFADQQATMTIEGTGAGSFLIDVSTDEMINSPALAKILTGQSNSKIAHNVLINHLHPDDFPIREQAYKTAAETGELNYEARFIWNDGSVHWVKLIGRYLYDNSGKGISLSGIVFDISDRIENEQKLRNSEEHLRSMIEQAPVATTLFLGKDMIINIPNEPMLKYWGKGDAVIGKPLREALPELVGQPFLQILNYVYESGQAYHARGERADLVVNNVLQTYYFDYTYKPLRNKDGEVYAIMDMAVDVTAQVESALQLKSSEERYRKLADELELRVQKRTNELRLANQELTNSNNNLQQFAYAASHDMQEPLRKIQAFSSRLMATYANELDANGVFMLNRMQEASRRMSLMIDDLLTYSRLTAKEGEFVPVKLNTIVTEVLSDLEIGIQEQKAEIEVEKLPTVLGNPRQLVQLIQNILSNSLKYRLPDQKPVIHILAKDLDIKEIIDFPNILNDYNYTCIEFQDNGIGFDEKHLDRIFQMFQRLHGKGEFNGSGIGLALCKKVVQNHHGYITARSEPGKGATFIVYLPLA